MRGGNCFNLNFLKYNGGIIFLEIVLIDFSNFELSSPIVFAEVVLFDEEGVRKYSTQFVTASQAR